MHIPKASGNPAVITLPSGEQIRGPVVHTMILVIARARTTPAGIDPFRRQGQSGINTIR